VSLSADVGATKAAAKVRGGQGGPMPDDAEDDLYVLRKKTGNLTLYDLGTQPENLSGTVDIITIASFDGFDDLFRASYHSFMSLNTDTHTVERLHTAVQLPTNPESLFVDLAFSRIDASDDPYIVLAGRRDKRPLLAAINVSPGDPGPYPGNQMETDWRAESLL
jgi:hypothetical protein